MNGLKIRFINIFKDNKSLFYFCITGFIFFIQIPTYYGEDIVNARNNYLTGDKTDFWGGVSTLIYGHIPNFIFRWQIWLAMIQVVLTAVGLFSLVNIREKKILQITLKLGLIYTSLYFSSQMTRDGLMFSILVFSISKFRNSCKSGNLLRSSYLYFFLIAFGMSFRPWLSFAIVPIVFIILKQFRVPVRVIISVSIIASLGLLPLGLETIASHLQSLKKSYPEQQVMIMDAAASYCYSNNDLTRYRSLEMLKTFTKDPNFGKYACQLYRPDTWLSLSHSSNTSSQSFNSDFWIIGTGDSVNYQKIRKSWTNLVLNDPVTFLQNKILFSGKLIIGSDTRAISFLSAVTIWEKFRTFFKLPFDLVISLHLISILASVLIILIGILYRRKKEKEDFLRVTVEEQLVYLSLVLWTGLSSIAFIGSNGRYTYSITLISFIILIADKSEKAHEHAA